MALSFAACAQIPGCTDGKKPIVLIDVDDRSGQADQNGAPVTLEKRKLEEAARDAIPLLKDYSFRLAKKDEVRWQISVRVQLATERTADPEEGKPADPNQVQRAVGLSMTLLALSMVDGKRVRYGTDVLERGVVARSEPFEVMASKAIRKGTEQIRAAIELADASDEKLIAALSSKDEKLRARAVTMVGQKKLKSAGPKLIEMLKNPKEAEDIILAAIGALVALGDPNATSALIDAGRNRPPAYLNQILFALSQIGGREAQAYLFTVASGHPDPQTKKNAKDALRELERRLKLNTKVKPITEEKK